MTFSAFVFSSDFSYSRNLGSQLRRSQQRRAKKRAQHTIAPEAGPQSSKNPVIHNSTSHSTEAVYDPKVEFKKKFQQGYLSELTQKKSSQESCNQTSLGLKELAIKLAREEAHRLSRDEVLDDLHESVLNHHVELIAKTLAMSSASNLNSNATQVVGGNQFQEFGATRFGVSNAKSSQDAFSSLSFLNNFEKNFNPKSFSPRHRVGVSSLSPRLFSDSRSAAAFQKAAQDILSPNGKERSANEVVYSACSSYLFYGDQDVEEIQNYFKKPKMFSRRDGSTGSLINFLDQLRSQKSVAEKNKIFARALSLCPNLGFKTVYNSLIESKWKSEADNHYLQSLGAPAQSVEDLVFEDSSIQSKGICQDLIKSEMMNILEIETRAKAQEIVAAEITETQRKPLDIKMKSGKFPFRGLQKSKLLPDIANLNLVKINPALPVPSKFTPEPSRKIPPPFNHIAKSNVFFSRPESKNIKAVVQKNALPKPLEPAQKNQMYLIATPSIDVKEFKKNNPVSLGSSAVVSSLKASPKKVVRAPETPLKLQVNKDFLKSFQRDLMIDSTKW